MISYLAGNRLARLALPVIVGIALASAMTWPLITYLGTDIPAEFGDPLFDAWHVAWVGHALLEHPLDLFQSNRFWPEDNSLAFNDVMLGYAPAGLVAAQGAHAALVVHNLLILFVYALAFVGAYFLARELGASWPGALVAGAAFAYAPWRLAHVRHLNVLSSGGIALALCLLVHGYRRGSWRHVLAGWLVATWQMTLGFSLGVQFGYLLLVLGIIACTYWLARGRVPVGRAVISASVAGVCVLALAVVIQARPYFDVVDAHPEARRTPDIVAFFSPPPRSFGIAPPESLVWGDATKTARDGLRWPIEQTLLPGVVILVLALLGLWSSVYPPGLRIGLASGIVVTGVLSLGLPQYPDGDKGFTPYRLLYNAAPGWDAIRTPGRLNTLTSLGLALLAGAGTCLVVRAVRRLRFVRTARARSAATVVTAALLASLVLVEGYGSIPHWPVPPVPRGQRGAAPPQLHLPTDYGHDLLYTYWSSDGFPQIVNGTGSFELDRMTELRRQVAGFPDRASVELLRTLGVRTVIFHPELGLGTPWHDAARRPIAGLPLRRETLDDVVLFHLAPPRA